MGLPDPSLGHSSVADAGCEDAEGARVGDGGILAASSSSQGSALPENQGSHGNASDYASSLSVGSSRGDTSSAPIDKNGQLFSAAEHNSSVQPDLPVNQDPANEHPKNELPIRENIGRRVSVSRSLLTMSSGSRLVMMTGSSERRLLPAPETLDTNSKGPRSQSLHDVHPQDTVPPRRRSPSRSPSRNSVRSRSRSRSKSPIESPKGSIHVLPQDNLEDILMTATSHVLMNQKVDLLQNNRTFKWSPSASRSPSLSPKSSSVPSPLLIPQPYRVPFIEHLDDIPNLPSPTSNSMMGSNGSSTKILSSRRHSPGRLSPGRLSPGRHSPGRHSPGRKPRGPHQRPDSPTHLLSGMTPHGAARDGKLDALKKLLPGGGHADTFSAQGFTCLHMAASHGRPAVVAWLLQTGSDPSRRSPEQGWTPLHLACRAGQAPCVELLLAAGADPRAGDLRRRTALHLACTAPTAHCVAAILHHAGAVAGSAGRRATEEGDGGPDADPALAADSAAAASATAAGAAAAAAAAADSDPAAAAGVKDVDDDQWTCVHFAARCNNPEALELLLAAGADPNALDSDGWAPLHNCARNGQRRCAEVLLKYRADARAATCSAETPLHIACRRSKVKLISLLLESARADGVLAELLLSRDHRGFTPEVACASDFVRNLFRDTLLAWSRQNDPQLARIAEMMHHKGAHGHGHGGAHAHGFGGGGGGGGAGRGGGGGGGIGSPGGRAAVSSEGSGGAAAAAAQVGGYGYLGAWRSETLSVNSHASEAVAAAGGCSCAPSRCCLVM